MRTVAIGLLLFAFSLSAQSPRNPANAPSKLDALLMQLQTSSVDRVRVSQQLSGEMLSLAEQDRQPSRATVKRFADLFTGALTGRRLTENQIILIRASLTDMLTGSKPNLATASSLRETLTALHLDASSAQAVTKSFLAIGEEVRGPDDSPLLSDK